MVKFPLQVVGDFGTAFQFRILFKTKIVPNGSFVQQLASVTDRRVLEMLEEIAELVPGRAEEVGAKLQEVYDAREESDGDGPMWAELGWVSTEDLEKTKRYFQKKVKDEEDVGKESMGRQARMKAVAAPAAPANCSSMKQNKSDTKKTKSSAQGMKNVDSKPEDAPGDHRITGGNFLGALHASVRDQNKVSTNHRKSANRSDMVKKVEKKQAGQKKRQADESWSARASSAKRKKGVSVQTN